MEKLKNTDVKPKRHFKGVWITRLIWEAHTLSPTEKIFLAEIDSLSSDDRGCFASNTHFARFFNLTPKYVSDVINGLVKKGFCISKIDKRKGNKRELKIDEIKLEELLTAIRKNPDRVSGNNRIGYPEKSGEVSGKNRIGERVYKDIDNTKTNTLIGENTNKNKAGIVKSPQEILDLDLKIVNNRKDFFEAINKIFRLSESSAHTFALIGRHITEQCQEGNMQPEIFEEAIRWAKMAKRTSATNKIGLFCKKLVEKTGYKKTVQLLHKI